MTDAPRIIACLLLMLGAIACAPVQRQCPDYWLLFYPKTRAFCAPRG